METTSQLRPSMLGFIRAGAEVLAAFKAGNAKIDAVQAERTSIYLTNLLRRHGEDPVLAKLVRENVVLNDLMSKITEPA